LAGSPTGAETPALQHVPTLVPRFAHRDASENAKKRGFLHWFTQNRHKKQAFFAFAHGQMPRESIM
jgi:hypothetical protein